jgi:hypothetical protein
MDERQTMHAVGDSVGIQGNGLVLLAKNSQLRYADILNQWLHSPEFYRDFAIPAFRRASQGIQIPPDFEQVILDPRDLNHNFYMEQLSLRAFRLFTLVMRIRADTIEVQFIRAPIEIGVLAYIHDDDIQLIPENILRICVQKILYDNLLVGRAIDTPFIATCDLYLDRPTGVRGGFHNDSNYYGGVDRVPGSEQLEYLSLLLLLENNASLVRGTSIMSILRENRTDNERVAISLPSMNGTNIIIHDNSFLHATPMPTRETVERVENLEQVSQGIGPRQYPTTATTTAVRVVHQPPVMTENRRTQIDTELARPKPRQFLRCHYLLRTARLMNYVAARQQPIHPDVLARIFNETNQQYDFDSLVDNMRLINNVGSREELNDALTQLTGEGRTIGGKKTKKRNKKTKKQKTYRRNVHMRGGVDKDQPIIITSDKKDMYDVSKYNTGAELVIDMDNGLYIEINKPVKK